MPMQTTDTGISGILPEDYYDLLVLPTAEASVAMQVSTLFPTDSVTAHIPTLASDATSTFLAEGAEIPESEAGFGDQEVTPKKAAALVRISTELAEDSNPDAQNLVGQSVARALADKIDQSYFLELAAPAPAGLQVLAGVTNVAYAPGLDGFAAAAANAEQLGAPLGAYVVNPGSALALATMKEAEGSNRSLLGTDPTQPTRRVIGGVPLYVSEYVADDVAWGIPKSRSIAVVRRQARIDVSPDAYFGSDEVGVRGTMRIAWAFPQPEAIQVIDLSAA